MERTNIAPGAYLIGLPADKFNRCSITIHFQYPARRDLATAGAVLPLVLERGYADCPDMTAMSRKLARLYGADLSVSSAGNGGNFILTVEITGIKDTFALQGEDLTREYTDILLGVAFRPYLVNGVFDAEAVQVEKQKVRQSLEDEINEKRLYCLRQARRKFYAGSPVDIERGGYLEEIDGVTPADVKKAYDYILSASTIDVVVQGADADEVRRLVAQQLPAGRAPLPLVPALAMPRQSVAAYQETMELVQAKLCMMFTTGQPVDPDEIDAARMAMSLFGGGVTSRLFLNVREKQSLCYYCMSGCTTMTGAMVVDSGVEPQQATRAEQAILKEWEDLKNGPITDEELEDCRRALLRGLQTVEDTLGGLENWYYMQVCRAQALITPEQSRQRLLAVTKEDVKRILSSYSYSVRYLLTTKEAAQ